MASARQYVENYISFVVSLIVPSAFGLPSVAQKCQIKVSSLRCAYPDAGDKMYPAIFFKKVVLFRDLSKRCLAKLPLIIFKKTYLAEKKFMKFIIKQMLFI